MDEKAALLDVKGLLRFDKDNPYRLLSREGTRLEYKQSFNWKDKDRYLRTIAAFANNQGGHIVFGIRDKPRELIGLTTSRFFSMDLAIISQYILNLLTPTPIWSLNELVMNDCRLGVISVLPLASKPSVVLKNDGVLREGDIYFRYRARTERIRYGELAEMLDQRVHSERARWMNLFEKVASIGVHNVGLLDLAHGELSGTGGKLYLDSKILDKVEFIREGNLTESKEQGVPTLRVIGEVEVGPTSNEVDHVYALSERELILGFLKRETPRESKVYLVQASREASQYMPIYYYQYLSQLNDDELLVLFTASGKKHTLKKLTARLNGLALQPIGKLTGTEAAQSRKAILDALIENDIEGVTNSNRTRLFEAITHYQPLEVPVDLLMLLAQIYEAEFADLHAPQQSTFRKAIAHLDEYLYKKRQ